MPDIDATPTRTTTPVRDVVRLIEATPPDVLWSALYGFPPDDPMFREIDGRDAARSVTALLATAKLGGLPIAPVAAENIWSLPERFDAAALAAASKTLITALDIAAADSLAATHAEAGRRDPFDAAGRADPCYAQHEALTGCLRTLFDMPAWWTAPRCPITLSNRPDDALWRIGVTLPETDLLVWRATHVVTESIGLLARDGDPDRLLDGPAGVPFRCVVGPAPLGYAGRIALASARPYFARSAASWLGLTAAERFRHLFGRSDPDEPTRRAWSGRSRAAAAAALHRLSGTLLGSLCDRLSVSGPFEPSGSPTTFSLVVSDVGGIRDPLAAFMTAAARGGDL